VLVRHLPEPKLLGHLHSVGSSPAFRRLRHRCGLSRLSQSIPRL
jgi:hypothetical protein